MPRRNLINRYLSSPVFGHLSYGVSLGALVLALSFTYGHETLGYYSLVQAIANPWFLLARFGLTPVLASDEAGLRRFPEYFKVRLVFGTVAILGSLASLAVYDRAALQLVAVFIIMHKAGENVWDVCLGLYLRGDRSDLYCFSHLYRAFVATAVAIAILSGLWTFVQAMGVLLLGWLTGFILGDGAYVRNLVQTRERGLGRVVPLVQLIRAALPTSVQVLADALLTTVSRTVLAWKFSMADVGVIALAQNIGVLLSFVVSAASLRNLRDGVRAAPVLNKWVHKVSALSIGFSLVLFPLRCLTPTPSIIYAQIFTVLSSVPASVSTAQNYLFTSIRRSRALMITSGSHLLLLIVSIPIWNSTTAFAITYFTIYVVRIVLCDRIIMKLQKECAAVQVEN